MELTQAFRDRIALAKETCLRIALGPNTYFLDGTTYTAQVASDMSAVYDLLDELGLECDFVSSRTPYNEDALKAFKVFEKHYP